MGTFGRDLEEGGGHTHGFSEADHGVADAVEGRRGVGEFQGGSITVSGGKLVGYDLHRETTGDGVTVG